MAHKDRRALGPEIRKVGRRSSEVLESKDLTLLAADQKAIEDVIAASTVEHRVVEMGAAGDAKLKEGAPRMGKFTTPGEYDRFSLTYQGEPRDVSYVATDGRRRKQTIRTGERIATLSAKISNFFPNDVVEDLLARHRRGAPQKEMYAALRRQFAQRGYSRIPTYETVTRKNAVKRPGVAAENAANPFPDANIFLILMYGADYTRGFNLARRMISSAADYYMGQHPYGDLCHAVGYARLPQFAERAGKSTGASPEATWRYLESVRKNGYNDWGVKFHANAGAEIVVGLPHVAGDSESRQAGALVVYDPKRMREKQIERPGRSR